MVEGFTKILDRGEHAMQASDFLPYLGPIPFSSHPVLTREEALQTFGTPYKSVSVEGEITWEHWLVGDVQVSATYNSKMTVTNLCFGVPLIEE